MKILISFFIFITITFSNIISPIPTEVEYNKEKALLGKKLFLDPRLSKNNKVSCASCHDLLRGGDDGLKVSVGIDGKKGSVNAPTVYNSVFNISQFWDGRAKDLYEQAEGPVKNRLEMGTDFNSIIDKLNKDSEYTQKFSIYEDGITKKSIIDALVEFEKALITPNSKFDRYLKSGVNTISEQEKQGYELFKSYGCISCHNGINVGGNFFQKFGVMYDHKDDNLGRYDVTKQEKDKHVFKVPSLRNVAQTAPYFHDGSSSTLENAISIMGQFQLGVTIPKEDITLIKMFLETLNGELPKIVYETE